MENHVTTFVYDGHPVRVVIDESEYWWVARDICEIIGVKNAKQCTVTLDEDEKGECKIYTPNGEEVVEVVNEVGLYTLIVRSKKSEAKSLKRWFTYEVLPVLHKQRGTQGMFPVKQNALSGKNNKMEHPQEQEPKSNGIILDGSVKKTGNMYFPMAKLVESADKYLEGRAALKALNYFTGMPVDDLLEELEEKQASKILESSSENYDFGILENKERVWAFISKNCEFGEEYSDSATKIYNAYKEWSKSNEKAGQLSMRAFGNVLTLHFQKRKTPKTFYYGIRLKKDPGRLNGTSHDISKTKTGGES